MHALDTCARCQTPACRKGDVPVRVQSQTVALLPGNCRHGSQRCLLHESQMIVLPVPIQASQPAPLTSASLHAKLLRQRPEFMIPIGMQAVRNQVVRILEQPILPDVVSAYGAQTHATGQLMFDIQ